MATIQQVALLAQVSVATVSRVLNGRIEVREETRLRIEQAVQELGYVPNHLARSLVWGQTLSIGLILPDILNPYFPGIARGVEDEARQAGWSVFLCNSDNDVDKEAAYVRLLHLKQVDGIVLVSSGQTSEGLASLLEFAPPIVLAGRYVEGADMDSVCVANVKGAKEATGYLLDLGHRAIATIMGSQSTATGRDRLLGYLEALEAAGIEPQARWVVDGEFQFDDSYTAMQQLLMTAPEITAVFVANDLMAVAAMKAIKDAGRSVPEDVAVVGFDGLSLGSLVTPQLTTMQMSPYEMGKVACQLLLDRIKGKSDFPSRHIALEATLLIRESCAAPPVKQIFGAHYGR